MSAETQQWLDENILVGLTAKRGDAWHRLAGNANSYEGPVPIERVRELLRQYEAEDVALNLADDNSPAEGYKAIVRRDTRQIYKIFKDGYQQHNYTDWLVEKVGDLLDEVPGDLVIANAGGLEGGAVAFVQIETPESFKAPLGYEFRPNFTAVTSLNGKFATRYKWMYTGTVCDNTLSAGLAEQSLNVAFKHTSKSLNNIHKVRADLALDFLNQAADKFAAEVEMLGSIPVNDKQWEQFLELSVPIASDAKGRGLTLATNKRDDLRGLWRSDPMVAPWSGTAFGVVQAVNTYDQWESIVKGKTRAERNLLNGLAGKMEDLDATTREQILSIVS